MAQHSNEHLTIAQLSAYIAKELASDELALCDAHLRTCQLCQGALADLRLTSALLRGMPQVEVPRSFVLPLNIAVLPETPTREQLPMRQARSRHYIVRRTLRALSTIAAVLGLVFILAGALSALPHGGAASNTATSSASGVSQASHIVSTPAVSGATRTAPSIQDTHTASPSAQQPTPTPTPGSSSPQATSSVSNHQAAGPSPPLPPPAVLDLGRAEGRLSIGSALFLLGLLGVILARRHQQHE